MKYRIGWDPLKWNWKSYIFRTLRELMFFNSLIDAYFNCGFLCVNRDISKKLQILREWHSFKADPDGRAGCMLIGYEAFRSLVFYTEKPKLELSQVEMDRIKKSVDEYLLTPGENVVFLFVKIIKKWRKTI